MINLKSRMYGSLLGLACGDALGAPVEFKARGSFPPVTGYQDGGPFNLKKGQWTDDTSLALCLAISLLENNGFNPQDQIKKYLRWYREGYMSCTGHCFDIGNTTKAALIRFENFEEIYSGNIDDPPSNGSLMRLAPIALYYFPDEQQTIHYAGLSSKVTHSPFACVEACERQSLMICRALKGLDKIQIFNGFENSFLSKNYEDLSGKGEAQTCLESALWCFYYSNNFLDGLLKAINLGDDTDTTGAVYGQLAGAFYGVENIPEKLINGLWNKNLLEAVANSLFEKKLNSSVHEFSQA